MKSYGIVHKVATYRNVLKDLFKLNIHFIFLILNARVPVHMNK